MKSQRDIELEMYYGGIDRAQAMMGRAEEKGRASTNPYASGILSDFVLPIASALKIELDAKRAGPRHAAAALLCNLDLEAVSFLTVRATINLCMQGEPVNMRTVATAIGRAVHAELVLDQIAADNPELYHTLDRDLARRQSRDERHRLTVMRMQAEKNGIKLVEWPLGARQQVGLFLLGLLQGAGMVEIEALRYERGKYAPQGVTLSFSVMEQITSVKGFVSISMPMYGPCIELPKDWTTAYDGGYHTNELRRAHPCLIRHPLARSELYRNHSMPVVLDAVNALQRTPWAVNGRMLDVMVELSQTANVGEVAALADMPKPEQPEWLPQMLAPKETWPEEYQTEFKAWKRKMSEWHTQRKLAGIRFGRFAVAVRMARMYREYERLYFVYFADSRGRLYPTTTGINPQGSDMQKALIHFADGLPLDTPEAIRWFHVHGANKWGFDKATLAERQQWVVDRQDQIISFADDPLGNLGWREAGDPLQFLAWCFEYAAWVRDTDNSFVSRIPISMDGSCNGLQNLSALLRDEVGGQATNLTDNTVMEDIYRRVAEAATERMNSAPYKNAAKERIRLMWLAHGITRSFVKRAVMTTPYGVTKRSAIDYVVEDTLKRGEGPPFEQAERVLAASVLMDHAWPAIGDIVVKGVQCMEWLKKGARTVLKNLDPEREPIISWISPSGFPAAQSYYEESIHQIKTKIAGGMRLKMRCETEAPDADRHSSGFAPNFVHSLDAAHLHLTARAAQAAGIQGLAMIHDDYGTHAANSDKLYRIIREQFARMYSEHDPLADLMARYPCLVNPPAKGSLDIEEVKRSEFFFS